jgi:hypothetical protein
MLFIPILESSINFTYNYYALSHGDIAHNSECWSVSAIQSTWHVSWAYIHLKMTAYP